MSPLLILPSVENYCYGVNKLITAFFSGFSQVTESLLGLIAVNNEHLGL